MSNELAHYWHEILPTGAPALHGLRRPRRTDRVDLVALDSILADPSAIAGFTDADDYARAEIVVELALWLEALPATAITETYRSRAARLRFLVWSLPFRLDEASGADILPADARLPESSVDDSPRRVLNTDTVLTLARSARDDWIACLRIWQDDPWLAGMQQRDPHRFERELHLVTHTSEPGTRRSAALSLVRATASAQRHRDDHARVTADLLEAHWLPRGNVLTGASLHHSRARPLLMAAYSLLALPPALFFLGYGTAALLSALTELGAGFIAAITLPARRDALLVLRLPAAAAAGALILLAFTPRWWLAPQGWHVGVGLTITALGYLVLETRLHGVTIGQALTRGLGIGVLGTLYAFLMALVIAGFVAPNVAEQGQCLTNWWTHAPFSPLPFPSSEHANCVDVLRQPFAASPASMITVLTGWSLAIGLAAQVLWDDRPVTTPLGRIRRTRGGTP